MHEATDVLQSGPVSNESRRTLEEELARCDDAAGYRRALVSERAFGFDSRSDLHLYGLVD